MIWAFVEPVTTATVLPARSAIPLIVLSFLTRSTSPAITYGLVKLICFARVGSR